MQNLGLFRRLDIDNMTNSEVTAFLQKNGT